MSALIYNIYIIKRKALPLYGSRVLFFLGLINFLFYFIKESVMYVNRLKHTYSYYNNIYTIRSQELFFIFLISYIYNI